MPSTFKHPAHVPMWKGAKVAYLFIAMCLFPVAIGGFWAYGNLVSIYLHCSFLIFASIFAKATLNSYLSSFNNGF